MSVPTQQGQFLGRMGLSREKTIHCTDCHNTDLFGTYLGGALPLNRVFGAFGFPTLTSCWDGSQNVSCPDYPGPITFDDTRGTAYRRPTDVPPDIPVNPEATRTASLNDPNTAQGPHGSIYKRILRANYDTKVGTADTALIGDTVTNVGRGNARNTYNPQNFALCYNCHAEAAFITPAWTDSGPGVENCSKDASGAFIPPKARLTNFYRCETGNVDGQNRGGNLHMLHLVGRTNARCHECHNNVHSNVEAGNTMYVGLNNPNFVNNNPGHNLDTHLINFQPNIRGNRLGVGGLPPHEGGAFDARGEDHVMWGDGEVVNPTDFSFGHKGPGCNLRCHGFSMDHNTDAHSVINGQK
jgi:hypothetical protein